MESKVRSLLDSLTRSPATTQVAENAETVNLLSSLPHDYLEIVQYRNGCEGFVGSTFIRLYPTNTLVALNDAYGTEQFSPGLVVFGSNGGGEAYAFDCHNKYRVVQIPFIPMDRKYQITLGNSITEVLLGFAQDVSDSAQAPKRLNSSLFGKEIHEVLPVVFGGSPTDQANKVALEPEKYAEYVQWWNTKYAELKKQVVN